MVSRAAAFASLACLALPGCLDASPGEETELDDPYDPLAEAPRATGSSASFMTWNLKTFPLSSRTPQIVATAIEEWQDDVIAIQEITDVDTFEAMVDALPEYEAVVNDDPGAWLRLGLIYKHERVAVSNVETLFEGDSWAFPRPPLKADVAITLDDGEVLDFTVVVVHLKSQIGEGTTARRRAAAVALHDWIDVHAGVDADPDVVVLGDFNEEIVALPSVSPFEAFLTRPEQYEFLTYELNVGPGYSQLSFQSFLDHILVTDDALVEYGDGSTVVLNVPAVQPAYERHVSDHLPVRAVFSPQGAPERTVDR